MMVAWSMRFRSSTATRKSREAFRFSAARGCRCMRCSTIWKGERPSNSSSISSRRSRSNRRLPPSGHEVSTVQAQGWSGTTNGELLRRAQGSFDVLFDHGSRSSAPAECECPWTAHRRHSSGIEPHGSSETAYGQSSEHSDIVAARTVARGRRLTTPATTTSSTKSAVRSSRRYPAPSHAASWTRSPTGVLGRGSPTGPTESRALSSRRRAPTASPKPPSDRRLAGRQPTSRPSASAVHST